MTARALRGVALAATAFLGLSACSTYGGYGYGGASYGASLGYASSPYYGWYDDFYYPGSGYYVYDRVGRRHAWNDGQRRYWQGRRSEGRPRANWNGYGNGLSAEARQQRREAWRAQRQQQGASDPAWQQRREAWRAERQQQGAGASGWQQRRESAQPRSPGTGWSRRRGN